ncbi:tRNA pseudouridine(55) synthase TruB [Desulfotomaculum copahuensis]|uniref:tRNA pseudouridine synthase B n=1 Tax=Desulfotomaculum copahuensis TaxID=1838280 RepID=A0A1B7LHU2_9FIRM|nr:tRNA pseudouridine(55) synthase TruB [Desulfotomaculum copahuensis]OAT85870.1 tRNA pseudouridine(55) synthase TruB [Desulfotomaculum copahuensis]
MDGIINLLKPPGMTSHDAVNYLRRLSGQKKAGHTGTLDPGAAGVLPICLGRATRLIQFMEHDKAYRAEITFGYRTDSGDTFGRVTGISDARGLTMEQVARILPEFTGEISQVPPMTSAVRYQGKKLYELARRGVEVERTPRRVIIHRISLTTGTGWGTARPRVLVDVECSAGTYIRSLCQDLGARLDCGATMSFLLRVRAGVFTLSGAITLEELAAAAGKGHLAGMITDADCALAHLPAVQVRDSSVAAVRHGNCLYQPGVAGMQGIPEHGGMVRLRAKDRLLAVARALPDERRPGRYCFQPATVVDNT